MYFSVGTSKSLLVAVIVLLIASILYTTLTYRSLIPRSFAEEFCEHFRCNENIASPLKYRTINLALTQNKSSKTTRLISCSSTQVKSVAFIKTHKTGSTTIGHIMNRFGYQRNLSFVLNRKRSNGHLVYRTLKRDSPRKIFLKPLNVTEGDYSNYKYDMITVHVQYNREAMDTFMRPDTRYITILRDPSAQFESAFVHFQFDGALPGNKTSRKNIETVATKIEKWFLAPKIYLEKLKELKWEGVKGLRYFYAQNNQIFDLGLHVELHENKTAVENYIDKLEKELDMVIISEYIEESLLVLKKQFCWSFEDILFISKNQRSEKAKNYTVSLALKHKMREWNAIDYKLYQIFNETLWKKINSYGPGFYDELKFYRKLLNETFLNCTHGSYYKSLGRLFQNINYKPANNNGWVCQLLAESKSNLMKRVRIQQMPPKKNASSLEEAAHLVNETNAAP